MRASVGMMRSEMLKNNFDAGVFVGGMEGILDEFGMFRECHPGALIVAVGAGGGTCTIVLVGRETANRKWINHEIVRSWDSGLGVVGIRVHGIDDRHSQTCLPGPNPFDFITHGPTKRPLSSIVKCYDPQGATSKDRYAWIAQHLGNAVEEAIKLRATHS